MFSYGWETTVIDARRVGGRKGEGVSLEEAAGTDRGGKLAQSLSQL